MVDYGNQNMISIKKDIILLREEEINEY